MGELAKTDEGRRWIANATEILYRSVNDLSVRQQRDAAIGEGAAVGAPVGCFVGA